VTGAVAAAGAVLEISGGVLTEAGIGLTAVGARGFVSERAEEFLRAAFDPLGRRARAARLARAVAVLAPSTTPELRHCALATLVSDPDQVPAFDAVYRAVFEVPADPASRSSAGWPPPGRTATPSSARTVSTPSTR
jgi:uncharacterized protein with von Willebrand factor type A (vWA) domain